MSPRDSRPYLNYAIARGMLTPCDDVWIDAYRDALAEAVEFHFRPISTEAGSRFLEFGQELAINGALQPPFPHTLYCVNFETGTPFWILACSTDRDETVLFSHSPSPVADNTGTHALAPEIAVAIRDWYANNGVGFHHQTFRLFEQLQWPSGASIDERRSVVVGIYLTVTALLLSRDVHHRVEPAPVKLNKHRARKGKSPIPERHFITIRPGAVHRAKGDGHGTHASPRTHWRRGHVRRLATGKITAVAPCIVNGADAALPTYRVREPA